MTYITEDLFKGLDSLEELRIDSTDKLIKVDAGLISNMAELKKFSWITAGLTKIPEGIFNYNTKLEKLTLWDMKLTVMVI